MVKLVSWDSVKSLYEKVKRWFTKTPGASIGWMLFAGAVLFQLGKNQISEESLKSFWTISLAQFQKLDIRPFFLSPFVYRHPDTMVFASIFAIITTRVVKHNISTIKQLGLFFGGGYASSRIAFHFVSNPSQVYLSGFSAGLAVLEGYNLSITLEDPSQISRQLMPSLLRIILSTLWMANPLAYNTDSLSKTGPSFRGYSIHAQMIGLTLGLALGEFLERRDLSKPVQKQNAQTVQGQAQK